MKKLLFIAITILTISCTSEPVENKECTKSYYKWDKVGYNGGEWIYDYVLQYSEPTNESQSDGFVSINVDTFYRVECK